MTQTIPKLLTTKNIPDSFLIGKGTLIGMGAVVVKDIDQNNVMIGNPAKLLKKLDY